VYADRRVLVFMASDPGPMTGEITGFADQVETQVTVLPATELQTERR
jgi:hypothetical protein